MQSSLALEAFIIGIVSACSLPLGTLTSAFWKPKNWSLAFLMAFGGGALLGALTFELVLPALEEKHFYSLALGCLLGCAIFLSLNQLINNYGGFLRKDAIAVQYIKTRRQRRFQQIVSHIGRISVFQNLSPQEVRQLASSVVSCQYGTGTTVYRSREPSEGLYIIEQGEVELLDPEQEMKPVRKLAKNDAFGRLAFFTGAPHVTVAVSRAETRIWLLPKRAIDQLLKSSPTLVEAVENFLKSEEIFIYLQKRHQMPLARIKEWLDRAIEKVQTKSVPQDAITVERKRQEFIGILTRIGRIPIFQQLPQEEVQAIASRIFCKQHPKGHLFFYQHEPAERIYIIERGEVALINSKRKNRKPLILREGDAFGAMAFLTGTAHTSTALATTDTTTWVMRKYDFNQVLPKCPQLEQLIRQFLQQGEVLSYLQHRQNFDPQKAARWTRQVLKTMGAGKLIPSTAEMLDSMPKHPGAPLAIWLGLVLDDIPESLLLGSSLVHSQVSFPLIACLFISNYPEALSSSVGMREQGFSFGQVLFMWTSLMLGAGIGAALGSFFFAAVSPFVFFLVEGIALGSVLTMIVQTMLPEAYFKGSSIIGFSTLLGFLVAIFFQTLE